MIFAIVSQKGGVGKSTTAHALATGLKEKGYKCLMVDMDPQLNLTYITGNNGDAPTAYDVMHKRVNIIEAIRTMPQGDILPSSEFLSSMDIEMASVVGKEYRLAEVLEPIRGKYDFIVIDTPPSLGVLTLQALTACDQVIIPSNADIFSLQGIGHLYQTIQTVKRYTNPNIKIAGILLTRHSMRTNLSKEVTDMIDQTAQKFNTKVFTATIRESVAIREAQAMREAIYTRSPKNAAVDDYRAFIDELLREKGTSL